MCVQYAYIIRYNIIIIFNVSGCGADCIFAFENYGQKGVCDCVLAATAKLLRIFVPCERRVGDGMRKVKKKKKKPTTQDDIIIVIIICNRMWRRLRYRLRRGRTRNNIVVRVAELVSHVRGWEKNTRSHIKPTSVSTLWRQRNAKWSSCAWMRQDNIRKHYIL